MASFSKKDPHGNRRRRRYRRVAFLTTIALAVLAVPAILGSVRAMGTMRNLPAEWLPDSLPLKTDFMRFVERFAVTDLVLIAWPDSTLDDPSLEAVRTLLAPLAEETGEEPTGEEPTGEKRRDSFADDDRWVGRFHDRVRRLCGHPRPLSWVRSGGQLVDELTARPINLSEAAARHRFSGTLVGVDDADRSGSRQTCVIVSLGPETLDHHRDLLPMIRAAVSRVAQAPVQDIVMAGGPVDGAAVDGESVRSIERYSLPTSIIACVLCFLCLRSIPLTVAIIAVATVGQGLVLAAVTLTGDPMNAVLIILPPLVFVLTVSAGIHLSHYFLDHRFASDPRRQTRAIASAMRRGTGPCVIATATTVVGMLSLTLVRLEPVRWFGIIASAGIAGTLIFLSLILPGAMTLCRPRRRDDSTTRSSTGGLRFVGVRRPNVTIAIFAVLAVIAAVGLPRLRTSVSVPQMFSETSSLKSQYRWFERNIGASVSADVLLDFTPEQQAEGDPIERLLHVMRVHAAVAGVDGVGGALSAATFLPPLPRGRSLSATMRRSVIRRAIENSDSKLHRSGYLRSDEQGETWRLSVRLYQSVGEDRRGVSEPPAEPDFDRVLKAIETAATSAIASAGSDQSPRVTSTGHAVIVQRTQELLLRDLFRSFVTAFALIAVVMMAMLRSFVGGCLAMLPNVFPAILMYGAMGWLNQPLDIGSVMTASVALGIAVDDSVHLLARFGDAYRGGANHFNAAIAAVRQCGTAMLHTTLVCGLSMLSYGLADFLPTRRFAIFLLALLATALIGVTTLLPALIVSPYGRRSIRSFPEH